VAAWGIDDEVVAIVGDTVADWGIDDEVVSPSTRPDRTLGQIQHLPRSLQGGPLPEPFLCDEFFDQAIRALGCPSSAKLIVDQLCRGTAELAYERDKKRVRDDFDKCEKDAEDKRTKAKADLPARADAFYGRVFAECLEEGVLNPIGCGLKAKLETSTFVT
jgi:hypothetical protein